MKLVSIIALIAASSVSAFAPSSFSSKGRSSSLVVPRMAGADAEFYIDMDRRNLMNLILLGSATVTVGTLAVPFIAFFLPPSAGGSGGGTLALDAIGGEIIASDYLAAKPAGDRSLAQGLKGDATYLIVKDDKTLESYGLNAVCTHLGCVVPWSAPNKKFMCPCHGSQYAPDGHVVRGPAPLPLALAHCDVNADGKVVFSPWTETDFRTGSKGWWV
jgi:cytochrome b6-f complex iron-sulfur subunit